VPGRDETPAPTERVDHGRRELNFGLIRDGGNWINKFAADVTPIWAISSASSSRSKRANKDD